MDSYDKYRKLPVGCGIMLITALTALAVMAMFLLLGGCCSVW